MSEDHNPFFIGQQRAIISLGPLSTKQYCTYNCPFCYVHSGFTSYDSLDIDDIIHWVKSNQDKFDIVYVSGDTDSFAPPRTEKALDLLLKLADIGIDLLFTTRHVFSDLELYKLSEIRSKVTQNNTLLFASTSVAQLNYPHLEPSPIRPPLDRIEQLGKFKEIGCISILSMRPFLPSIPVQEYKEILELAKNKVDIVLGSNWYADKNGILESKIMRTNSKGMTDTEFKVEGMDYNSNHLEWKVFSRNDVQVAVQELCSKYSIPFFMRSRPAIDWSRQN